MTALDDIAAAALSLNGLTLQEASEKDRIDAAVAAALAAILAPTRTVYLDAAAGADTNDGTTAPRAVKTPQKAAALMSAGQAGTVVMCSDVVLTAPLIVPTQLQFVSDWLLAAGADNGSVKRKLTVAGTAMPGAGGSAINQIGEGGQLVFYGVELHVAAVPAGNGLGVIAVRDTLQFLSCAVTWDAGLGVPLIQPFSLAKIYFGSTSLPADYPGKVFVNVPAGGNLNNGTGACRTNLTSA